MAATSSNSSIPPPSSQFSLVVCLSPAVGVSSLISINVPHLLLPLYLFVLYLAGQRWRWQLSGLTASHSEVFTTHMMVVELMNVVGSALICGGILARRQLIAALGIYFAVASTGGQGLFHVFTCLDRYLAVVYPVIYRSLRTERGGRMRNATVGGVWLLILVAAALVFSSFPFQVVAIGLMVGTLIAVSFCSLSVLCVLIRPGPGEEGGARKRVDLSKLKAFYTITAILGALLLKFGGGLLSTMLVYTGNVDDALRCGGVTGWYWFGLPSSLVLPLLFLQRAGKLACWKSSNTSGRYSS
ncbi:uncharacterized protein V6R79_009029 [Siganus canaliculatus]